MRNLHQLKLAAAVAAVLLTLPSISCLSAAEESEPVPTGTGQSNLGFQKALPVQSSEVSNIPTPEEVQRALMMPISKQPSVGDAPITLRPEVQTFGGPSAKQESQNAIGGLQGLTAAGSAPRPDASKAGGPAASKTTGAGSAAAGEPPPSGPIGAVGETMPAKFSKRNDILDRIPIMALPLRLTDQQRKLIYNAVMADNSQPVPGADALKPASELSTDQALNGMRPLPQSVRGIDVLVKLQYVKAKNKVLLVEPATRTVVDQITS